MEPTPNARVIQCKFCAQINVPDPLEQKPICVNCGLELHRNLVRPHTPALDAPQGARNRKEKRRKNRQHSPVNALSLNVDGFGLAEANVFVASERPAPSTFSAPVLRPSVPTVPTFDDMGNFEDGPIADETFAVSGPAAVATQVWALQLEDGKQFVMSSGDIIVGRQPRTSGDATLMKIEDKSRTLSATHARFVFDADTATWTVTDLGATNGVATVDGDTGALTLLSPGQPVDATEYLLLGTLKARLCLATPTQ